WCGFALAALGLLWLVGPAAARPDLLGALLMALAGVAWGVYTVLGRSAGEPVAANARAFVLSTPLALLACVVLPDAVPMTDRGFTLAVVSGALTSGIGYAIWYRALPQLGVARAAFAQLAVPALAAFGAVAWLGEAITLHLVLAAALVLGGTAMALAARTAARR
ncbi:MAG: DMT family transporter, partial [Planctomycetota bacterium]